MDEDYYPKSLQEELNDILEAFYSCVSEQDIRKYQAYLEDIRKQKIAEGAVKSPSMAPDFTLVDQDDETVHLHELLKKGPVVVVFYRGKWCPHCNATIVRLQRHLHEIKAKGATLVAISPMLPDGTQVFASKKCLEFPVLSDSGNQVARKFKITFVVPEEIRPDFLDWKEDLPAENGDDSWEIPLPATYIISQKGEIVWSFIDNDPGCRAEPEDIVAAIPTPDDKPGFQAEANSANDSTARVRMNDSRARGSNKNRKKTNRSLLGTVKDVGSRIRMRVRNMFRRKKQAAEQSISLTTL